MKCNNCGCRRNIIISAKITNQKEKATMGFKPLCIECFLKQFDFYNEYEHKINYDKVMETI